jgi:hypothetical protein
MKKKNWEAFAVDVNIHFPNDVQHTWGQCRNKLNKMKDKYNVEKKKTNIIVVAPSNWPLYKKFNYIFPSIAKIVGIPQVVDYSVNTIHRV